MRKLIERKESDTIVICDNPKCEFKVLQSEFPDTELKEFINVACPNCGENLLTEKDYLDYLTMLRVVDWLNRWFSWTTVFVSKKKFVEADIHVHDGVKIKQRK